MNRNDMAGAPTSPVSMSGLNEDLDTNALDLDPTDQGLLSTIIRLIAGAVGKCCRPRQILVILRLLKAVTFCFLILTVCADLMYLIFVEFLSSDATENALGGVRDTIVRIYGVALAVLAILIELDITAAVRHFPGFKAFVPRGLLLFFVATITNASLLVQRQTTGASNNGGGNCNDDAYGGGDDANAGDDYVLDDDAAKYENIVEQAMPNSAVAFQMVVSWVL